MTTRTFKQYGQAYGGTQASIVATIDGVEVYSGNVPTVDELLPTFPQPDVQFGEEMFSWTNTVDFAGTQTMTIAVTGSMLLITDSFANYALGNADVFSGFNYSNIDGIYYSMPLSDVTIDGVVQPQELDPELPGQAYWQVPAGSTFSCTVNIQAGLEQPPTP